MYIKYFSFCLILMLLILLPADTHANEMQLQFLNAGLNLGWAATMIELQGITPTNQTTIRDYLNNAAAAITRANELLRQPFVSLDFMRVVNEINRFWTYTTDWTISQRASYVRSIYNMMKTKVSYTYYSRRGFDVVATCDTFIFASEGKALNEVSPAVEQRQPGKVS